ncbi:UDP-2,4-diacetamido-2,4,6-trideoxy-beta-L-altropyranose hydrolase [Caulobacter sp. 73W]|uniref:UDP-2,4-diacetamido-2,4, 6-trideoxy-beta-L-altropyranose hydrolase n=1 Tax=Caulobacter sp. 73W TaxID=3161137 RepID=A0AB39KQH8_9CAUL
MRSLTLAHALADRGHACAFHAGAHVSPLLDAFADQRIGREARSPEQALDYDLVVFDHYGLSEPDHRAMAAGRPTMAIDDLADRLLGADLVLDAGPDRRAEDYAGLTPKDARLLLGPSFAPVRAEFARLRDETLRRRATAPVRRVLVSLGLTDLDGVTGRVIDALLTKTPRVEFDVVVGSQAPSLPRLRDRAAEEPRLRLHEQTHRMAELTAAADIAIGAGGSTSWERCTLGLPTILVILAENQAPAAHALERRGAVSTIQASDAAFAERLEERVGELLREERLRAEMSEAAAAVCDGLGAARTADAILTHIKDVGP